MIVGLIQVMLADNEIAEGEREMLGGVLAKLGCNPEEVFAVGELIKNPVNANDFLNNLPDMQDRRDLIQAMAIMAMSDGEFADAELNVIHKIASHLDIPAAEVSELIDKGCALIAGKKE
ncbi:TerB family tellurite resistance protein [bacterium]|nr:TerB family tellurite resistance protein [bacterium]